MKLTPTDFGGAMAVDSYGPGFFRIGRTVYHGPVLVTATSSGHRKSELVACARGGPMNRWRSPNFSARRASPS